MEGFSFVPALSGVVAVAVMTLFLRRARFLHLPETQMVRAVGSYLTKDYDRALLPGTLIHFAAGMVFAYLYWFLIATAPDLDRYKMLTMIVICTLMGLVHGLIVTLFLVIAVSQYHPLERFRRLNPGDRVSHVVAHIAFGATLGFCFVMLPRLGM